MSQAVRPPLGPTPRYIHEARRMQELQQAIERGMSAGLVIKQDWVDEYNELAAKVKAIEQPPKTECTCSSTGPCYDCR